MKTVTLEEFKTFNPCWMETEEGTARLEKIGSRKKEWTALDVLRLEEVSAEDRLWAVLREEFVPAHTLHEFACRCAEGELRKAGVTDDRSWNAIRVKRLWIEGKATDTELAAARDAARVAARDAAWDAAQVAARAAARVAARDAARAAARAAAWDAAWDAARAAAEAEHIKMLIALLEE